MGRKRKARRPGPVENGHDRRAEEGRPVPASGSEAQAPDGVSGDWR